MAYRAGVSDPRYHAGILAGIRSSLTPGIWPDEVPGVGPMRGGQPLARCCRCGPEIPLWLATTFVRYGEQALPLCKLHARAVAQEGT